MKTKKGCGEGWDGYGSAHICGKYCKVCHEIPFHPKCKPKNNSQQSKVGQSGMPKRSLGALTTAGTNATPGGVKPTDFNLKEKLLALRRYLPDPDKSGSMIYWQGDNKKNRGIYVDLGAVMGWHKEFIQRLKVQVILQIKKEEHCDGCYGYKEIDECSTCKPHFDKIRKKIDKLSGGLGE